MHFKTWPAICFDLDQSKILSSGNGLKNLHTRLSYSQEFSKFESNTTSDFGSTVWLSQSEVLLPSES